MQVWSGWILGKGDLMVGGSNPAAAFFQMFFNLFSCCSISTSVQMFKNSNQKSLSKKLISENSNTSWEVGIVFIEIHIIRIYQ